MNREKEHSYLRRLPEGAYQGDAAVHWSMTTEDRETGWLNEHFHAQFRESLTHTAFRHGICYPLYTLMPDHMHLLCLGWQRDADQRKAIRFLRKHLNRILETTEYALQKQPYDNVLSEKDRQRDAFMDIAAYIRQNPLRSGLVGDEEELARYPYSGCLFPGYPELNIHAPDYWPRAWRIYDYLLEQSR